MLAIKRIQIVVRWCTNPPFETFLKVLKKFNRVYLNGLRSLAISANWGNCCPFWGVQGNLFSHNSLSKSFHFDTRVFNYVIQGFQCYIQTGDPTAGLTTHPREAGLDWRGVETTDFLTTWSDALVTAPCWSTRTTAPPVLWNGITFDSYTKLTHSRPFI